MTILNPLKKQLFGEEDFLMGRWFVLLVWIPMSGWANVIEAGAGQISMKAFPSSNSYGEKRVRFCTTLKRKSSCQNFPKGVDQLFGGSPKEWNHFYRFCYDSEHLNNLTMGVQIAQVLALPPKAASFALGSAFGTALFFAPEAYPSVSKEAAYRAIEKVAYLLYDGKEKHILKTTRPLVGIEKILETCSRGYRAHLLNSKQKQCMRGCHRTEGSMNKVPSRTHDYQLIEDFRAEDGPWSLR